MSAAGVARGARERVLAALDRVVDPELDEPITALRFVRSCEVTATGEVAVTLRLPTPQCAPNFAFLMAADARSAVLALPEVRGVTVRLEDHCTAEEINAALGRDEGFTAAFPGETDDDDLGALRELFQRKALTARQSRICQGWLDAGATPEQAAAARVRDLPDSAEARRCLELRGALGLSSDADAPAFVLPDGQPVQVGDVARWLRMGRLVRTSLEANGGICRSLLRIRHELAADADEEDGR